MTVHLDQNDPNCKHIRINFRACAQLPLDIYGIDASIYTQNLKKPHDILVHLEALENVINTDIGTLNKDRVDIFSELWAKISKAKFLRYVNGILFEMVITALKRKYLGTTTTTALQN